MCVPLSSCSLMAPPAAYEVSRPLHVWSLAVSASQLGTAGLCLSLLATKAGGRLGEEGLPPSRGREALHCSLTPSTPVFFV